MASPGWGPTFPTISLSEIPNGSTIAPSVTITKLYLQNEILGKGSYGAVLGASATLDSFTDSHYALKIISKVHKKDAVIQKAHKGGKAPYSYTNGNLLEPLIMMSIHHPSIMRAELVVANAEKMVIVMKRVKGHLSTQHKYSLARVQYLIRQVVGALVALHDLNIIHCDIKPGNILLLNDKDVALNDFGMSVRQNHPTETFSHRVGTGVYRAPELLAGMSWGKAIDIWALGCTIYEIAYGCHLFPSQSGFDHLHVPADHTHSKREQRERMLNAIMDWITLNQQHYQGDLYGRTMSKTILSYETITLPSQWKASGMLLLNDLIIALLNPIASGRPNIRAVLDHPFLTIGLSENDTGVWDIPKYHVSDLPTIVTPPAVSSVLNLLEGYYLFSNIMAEHLNKLVDWCIRIYARIEIPYQDSTIVLLATAQIVGKVIYHQQFQPRTSLNLSTTITEVELLVLRHLGYTLDFGRS